ncbi:hypothetical protein FOA52_005701 [Chlamydomonas sp. UWO 241]|nr:hypothetical protein FOA52_005701 [Chlamydomonas sp. UWO 241]
MTGAPSTFSRLMHHILRDTLDRSVVVCLDDILIFSRTKEEHLKHLAEVLEILRRHQLYARLSKCEFGKRQTTFLGHIVSGQGIEMEPSKINAVVEWPAPQKLREAHDGPLSGHFGRDKTYSRLCQSYYWPRMRAEVEDYCRSCPSCQTIKPSQQKQMGLHKPLQLPDQPGQSASMDLIVGLPRPQSGKTAILVIVDRLSKRVALEPCLDNSSAVELAHMLHKAWTTMGFGLPADIISDRDPRFLSDFWKQLHAKLGTKLNFSTAYHPQTDGQTEPTTGRPNVDAAEHSKLVLDGIKQARECLLVAQERQSASVNKSRRDVTFKDHEGESQFEWRLEYAKAPPPDVIGGEEHVHVDSFLGFKIVKSTSKTLSHLQFYVKFTDGEKLWRPAADLKSDTPKHYATLVKRLDRHTNQTVPDVPRGGPQLGVKRAGRKAK